MMKSTITTDIQKLEALTNPQGRLSIALLQEWKEETDNSTVKELIAEILHGQPQAATWNKALQELSRLISQQYQHGNLFLNQ